MTRLILYMSISLKKSGSSRRVESMRADDTGVIVEEDTPFDFEEI